MTSSDFQTAGGKAGLGPIVMTVIIGTGSLPSQESNAEGGRDLQCHIAQHFVNFCRSHTNHFDEFLPCGFIVCTVIDSLFKNISAFICKSKEKKK